MYYEKNKEPLIIAAYSCQLLFGKKTLDEENKIKIHDTEYVIIEHLFFYNMTLTFFKGIQELSVKFPKEYCFNIGRDSDGLENYISLRKDVKFEEDDRYDIVVSKWDENKDITVKIHIDSATFYVFMEEALADLLLNCIDSPIHCIKIEQIMKAAGLYFFQENQILENVGKNVFNEMRLLLKVFGDFDFSYFHKNGSNYHLILHSILLLDLSPGTTMMVISNMYEIHCVCLAYSIRQTCYNISKITKDVMMHVELRKNM